MSANRLLTALIVATGQDGSACIYVSSSRSKHCHNHGATLNKVANRIQCTYIYSCTNVNDHQDYLATLITWATQSNNYGCQG